LLAEKAESVQGWDYSAAAIEMAQQHYQTSNAVFYVVDAEKEFPKNKKFNAVVSFETIEHLESPEHFINEVAKILTEDGRLVLSTPFVDFRGFSGRKFHKKEMTSRQLYKLLSQRFSHIQFFIQPAAGDYILPFWRRFFEDCSTAQTSIVAVCSNAPLPVSSSSLKNLGRTYFNGIVKRKVKDLLIGMGLSDLKSKR
jgi:SAM-dependent methyltransferase